MEQAEAAAGPWCAWCGDTLRLSGDAPPVAVHSLNGQRKHPDGHVVLVVDREPPLWQAAREIAEMFAGLFDVTARFRVLRADWRNPPLGLVDHYEADGNDEMVAKLTAALAGRPQPAGGAVYARRLDGSGGRMIAAGDLR